MIQDIEVLADRYEEEQQFMNDVNEHERLIDDFVNAMALENYTKALQIGEEFKAKFGPIDPEYVVSIMKQVTKIRQERDRRYERELAEFNQHLNKFR